MAIMRDEGVIALLLVLVIASAGAGYYVGIGSHQTATVTNTAYTSYVGPNPNIVLAMGASCSKSQSSCMINVTENTYSGQIGGFGSIQWGCEKTPLGQESCQGAYLSCKPTQIVAGGNATIICDAETSYALPAQGTNFYGLLYAGEGSFTSPTPFVGNFTE